MISTIVATSTRIPFVRVLLLGSLLAALSPGLESMVHPSCRASYGATLVQAQSTASTDVGGVESTPKGTIGAALIGAELGAVIPAVFGVDETWPYLVFPALGAGGGIALGALVVDKDGNDPALGVALLAVGTAGLIPALVVSFSATAYNPENGSVLAQQPGVETASRLAAAERAQAAARAAGPGLLRWSPQGMFVGAPAVTVIPGNRERATEIAVPVVSGLF